MPDYTVNVVNDALDILMLFDYFHLSYNLTEIAHAVGIPKSKALRLLYTLEEKGYVTKDADSGNYSLGPTALRIGRVGRVHQHAHRIIQESMWYLSDKWKETINFGVIQGKQLVYSSIIDSPYPFRIVEKVGDVLPIDISAMGRAILAECDNPLFLCSQNILDKISPIIEEIHWKGYAVDNEETEPGVRCVGTAIKDVDGGILGGISVTGPITRLSLEIAQEIGNDLRELSQRIEQSLANCYNEPKLQSE